MGLLTTRVTLLDLKEGVTTYSSPDIVEHLCYKAMQFPLDCNLKLDSLYFSDNDKTRFASFVFHRKSVSQGYNIKPPHDGLVCLLVFFFFTGS